MAKRIAIFAHWDRDNLIDEYVVYYLTELKKVADIVFVSDGNLSENELNKVTPLVLKSIARRHGEYDFGSYKRGVLDLNDKLNDYDELIFANDSCYGPFFPFTETWKQMEAVPCDYWGLFKHRDPTINIWHIQSYFIVFKKQVFTSPSFQNFMKNISTQKKKMDVVLKYEVGLSDTLDQSGFKSAALCPPSITNDTHSKKTCTLTLDHNLPLLKRSLLVSNPLREPRLYEVLSGLKNILTEHYPYELIKNHLQRTAPKNYLNGWFHPDLRKATLLHKKFIRIKEKSGKYFCYITIKIFGISCLILPSRFLTERWKYERKNKNIFPF